jgi:multidrug resistance protein MdtO
MSDGIVNYDATLERPRVGLWNILWDELKPFPGRDLATLRMAIVCTAIVLLSNTFRLPFQDVLPFLALFTAKEEKITTSITAILVLLTITVSIGAAILLFKLTGNRPEFRIPGMAMEIFVGMYLFRILSIGPVGFILAFIVSVAQSVVDLFPTPEEAVHQFLWLWVAVALGAVCGWLATVLLFPVSVQTVLQREFTTGWQTVSVAAKQLRESSVSQSLLYPLAKLGPIRLLKVLKLSLLETPGLRPKQKELTRLSLALDKVAKLLFSYSNAVATSSRSSYKADERAAVSTQWRALHPGSGSSKNLAATKALRSRELIPTETGVSAISSSERVVLGRLAKKAEYLEQEFSEGFVPSGLSPQQNERERAGTSGNGSEALQMANERERATTSENGSAVLQLIEAERTLEDLAEPVDDRQEAKPPAKVKKSLFVADAFTNPRHVQFALKVTLAGMIGYIFYSASDYFGIHTVYYTPLIIALGSTGATMYKGVLRIAGCVIGGALGLICTIWLIPRFDNLGMYLLTVFCVHALAAWIAFGSERISYVGLQIALAFDLGVLADYGPSTEIDPIRDRFIGIILGIVIISTVFSLVWPEDARTTTRQKLAACLQAIARLLNIRSGRESNSQRERLELEIASHLAEANAAQEQAAFEALIHGPPATRGQDLETATAAVEEVYVACLPAIRQQTAAVPDRGTADREAATFKPLLDAVEASGAIIESSSHPGTQDELVIAVKGLQLAVQAPL